MPQGLFIILLSRTFKFMTKKLFLAGATLLLAAAAVTGFAAYDKSNVSDLLDANVEALARNEENINCSTTCPYNDCGSITIQGTEFALFRCMR